MEEEIVWLSTVNQWIQEPIILCEPQIMTSHKRLARVLTAGDGGFVNRCMRMADIQIHLW
jgi:hypothetical protein